MLTTKLYFNLQAICYPPKSPNEMKAREKGKWWHNRDRETRRAKELLINEYIERKHNQCVVILFSTNVKNQFIFRKKKKKREKRKELQIR